MTPPFRLITAAPTTTIEEARHILYTHRIESFLWWMNTACWPAFITETDIQKRAMFADASRMNTATCAAAPPWVSAPIIWTEPKPLISRRSGRPVH